MLKRNDKVCSNQQRQEREAINKKAAENPMRLLSQLHRSLLAVGPMENDVSLCLYPPLLFASASLPISKPSLCVLTKENFHFVIIMILRNINKTCLFKLALT